MSSLHESISLRRAAEPAGIACVSLGQPQSALLVVAWCGPSWVFPWSYLVNVRFTEPPGELVLSFTSHVVTAEGENLGRILEDLASFRVSCLRDLPGEYRCQTVSEAPFIRRLSIRETRVSSGGSTESSQVPEPASVEVS